jgi:hypothetical protein
VNVVVHVELVEVALEVLNDVTKLVVQTELVEFAYAVLKAVDHVVL